MKPIIFALFDNQSLIQDIKKQTDYEIGTLSIHQFPDEESVIQLQTDVKNRHVIFIANLKYPNNKILPLIFAANTAKTLKAKKVGLIAPYLPYMRQDKKFHFGEGISAIYFANLLSRSFDWLITIEPHLHRIKSLQDIYTIPTFVLHATNPIASWIKNHVHHPLLIGPDSESEQWVSAIAQKINCSYLILEKHRISDREVRVSLSPLEKYIDHTPVLVDDIISTGKTMIATIQHLQNAKMRPPICIAVHALFAESAYDELLKTGADKVVTCNTIKHPSNSISIYSIVVDALKNLKEG